MPKQIFQRPVPVRHDNFGKKQRSGPPVHKGGKPTQKPSALPAEKPMALPGSVTKLLK